MTELPSVRLAYVIAATPRSGSELLCEALTLTGVAGRPGEHFQHWTTDSPPAGSVRDLAAIYREGTGDNGVFGVKIMWDQLTAIAAFVAQEGEPARAPLHVLACAWPRLRVVYLSRRDVLRQAVSWSKAISTGQWASNEPPAENSPVYDPRQIEGCRRAILEQQRAWATAFHEAALVPHSLTYEELVADYVSAISNVLGFLGLPAPDPATFFGRELQVQSDATNEEWIRRFLEDAPDKTCDLP